MLGPRFGKIYVKQNPIRIRNVRSVYGLREILFVLGVGSIGPKKVPLRGLAPRCVRGSSAMNGGDGTAFVDCTCIGCARLPDGVANKLHVSRCN